MSHSEFISINDGAFSFLVECIVSSQLPFVNYKVEPIDQISRVSGRDAFLY